MRSRIDLPLKHPPVVIALVISMILGASGLIANTPTATSDQSGLEFLQYGNGEVFCETETTVGGRPAPEICTHGGDILPNMGDRRSSESARIAALNGKATLGIECYGDGVSGPRVQAIYARMSTSPDNYAATAAQIEGFAVQMEAEVSASAALTGGIRHIRWVTKPKADGGCELDIKNVVMTETATVKPATVFRDTIKNVSDKGFNQTGRAYMIWMDHDPSRYCGIGTVYPDDDPTPNNRNYFGPSWSRVDPVCWGSAETHELGHNLGAVQDSAPNSNGSGHCIDDRDLMCYDDGSGATVIACADLAFERRWDCNNNDYFHTNPPAGSYLANNWNIADSPFLSSESTTSSEGAGAFHSVTPVRAYDSRDFGNAARIKSAASPSVIKLTGLVGVPGAGVAAVAVNITVTDPLGPGFLTAYSYDLPAVPTVSNINFAKGETRGNSAVITVPYDGLVKVIAGGGSPHVIFDVVGWYADDSGYSKTKGGYHAITPERLVDTRTNNAPIGEGPSKTRHIVVAGVGTVPSDAAAVVLNVVSVASTKDSYLTVWPTGIKMPLAASLNHRAGAIVPNQVIAKLNNGSISVFNAFGDNHIVIDVAGWYDAGGTNPGAVFRPVDAVRVLDTRNTTGLIAKKSTFPFTFVGTAGNPSVPVGAVAVAANVTVTQTSSADYLTAWPSTAATRPPTAILNWTPAQTVGNFTNITLGDTGAANFYTPAGSYQLIVDVAGWFEPPKP